MLYIVHFRGNPGAAFDMFWSEQEAIQRYPNAFKEGRLQVTEFAPLDNPGVEA